MAFFTVREQKPAEVLQDNRLLEAMHTLLTTDQQQFDQLLNKLMTLRQQQAKELALVSNKNDTEELSAALNQSQQPAEFSTLRAAQEESNPEFERF